jgi:predicted nuclease of predicted toxin-antitoxin system
LHSPLTASANSPAFPCEVAVRRESVAGPSADDIGLRAASDTEVWEYALSHEFAIVTKDSDFRHKSSLRGYPPKVIWISLGNCSTRAVEDLLRQRVAEVTEFLADGVKAFLVLS